MKRSLIVLAVIIGVLFIFAVFTTKPNYPDDTNTNINSLIITPDLVVLSSSESNIYYSLSNVVSVELKGSEIIIKTNNHIKVYKTNGDLRNKQLPEKGTVQ